MEKQLQLLYYKPEHLLQGVLALYHACRERSLNYSMPKITNWLRKQRTYQLHFQPPRVRVFHPITSKFQNEFWQADLVDISKLRHANSGFNFLLTVIDVRSKNLFVQPLKKKAGAQVAAAFQQVFKDAGAVPKRIQTDNGLEFLNADVLHLFKTNKIKYNTCAPGDHRAMGVIERVNRTLMTKVSKYLTANKTKRFIDVLPKIVASINDSVHRTTGQKPNAYKKTKQAAPTDPEKSLSGWFALPINVGDKVRVLLERPIFAKGYKQYWSNEVYTVKNIGKTYKVKDIGPTFKRYELLLIEDVQDNPFIQTKTYKRTEHKPKRKWTREGLDKSNIIEGKRRR